MKCNQMFPVIRVIKKFHLSPSGTMIKCYDVLFTAQGMGGIQVCGIMPCLNEEIDNCAVRADSKKDISLYTVTDVRNKVDMVLTETVFSQIKINGVFMTKDSFISTNILERHNLPNHFGQLLDSHAIKLTKSSNQDSTITANLSIVKQSDIKLVSAGLYNRVYSRDGPSSANSISNIYFTLFLALTILLLLKFH